MRRGLSILAVSLLLTGVAGACSSDDDGGGGGGDATTTTAESSGGGQGGDTTETTGGGAGDTTTEESPEVAAYCADAEELATQIRDVLENRQNIDAEAVAANNETAAQLAESAVNLLDQYPDEAQRLNDCTAVLNEAAATQPSN